MARLPCLRHPLTLVVHHENSIMKCPDTLFPADLFSWLWICCLNCCERKDISGLSWNWALCAIILTNARQELPFSEIVSRLFFGVANEAYSVGEFMPDAENIVKLFHKKVQVPREYLIAIAFHNGQVSNSILNIYFI